MSRILTRTGLALDYKHVLPKLEHVTLTCGRTLYHADQEIACEAAGPISR